MRHDFIDRYSRLSSPLHRLPAGAKLLGAVVLVTMIVSVPWQWGWFFIAAAAMVLGLGFVSRVPPLFLLTRLLLLEPLALGTAALTLLQPDGPARFIALLTRTTLSLAVMILLSNTTPFAALLDVMRLVRVPALLVTTLALLYRYLFVLIDEAERMQRARVSRTFVPQSRMRLWRMYASVIAQVGIRSLERSERIYAAMRARGWQ